MTLRTCSWMWWAMLKYFLIEEYRRHIAMTKRYSLFVFPAYVIFFTVMGAVFIKDVFSIFPYNKFILLNMISLFIYGFGVGSFEFLGRSIEGYNLTNTSSILPISGKKIYLYAFLRDAIYYTILFLLPVFAGLMISIPLSHLLPLQISIFSLSLILAMFLGYSASYLSFSLYYRSKIAYILYIIIIFIYIMLSYLSVTTYIVAEFQITKNIIYLGLTLTVIIIFSLTAYYFTPKEIYEKRRTHHNQLTRLNRHVKKILISKELIDVIRGNIILKSTLTYFLPMVILFVFVRILNSISSHNIYNALSLTVMLSIFSTVIYSWLTIMDDYKYMETLPLRPWDVIKTHIYIHIILVSFISIPIIIFLNYLQPQYLVISFMLFYLNVFYLISITAYLAGYRVTSMLFDPEIVMKFSILSVVPGIILTISSINIGRAGEIIIAATAALMLLIAGISIKKAKKRWIYFN